jgi:hypothetical protein
MDQTAQLQQQDTALSVDVPIPEKFMRGDKPDVAALAKAYVELERKLGQRASAQQAPANEAGTAQAAQTAAAPSQNTVPGLLPEQVEALNTEFAKNGRLSEESYNLLGKAGYPRHVVDAYIRGMLAEAAKQDEQPEVDPKRLEFENKIKEEVGGDKAYAAMAQWAAANLSPAEIAAFNEVVTGRSPEAARLAVLGLAARYRSALGSDPARVVMGGGAGGVVGFASREQAVDAMKDPRYARDPAYRAEVQRKLLASEFARKG